MRTAKTTNPNVNQSNMATPNGVVRAAGRWWYTTCRAASAGVRWTGFVRPDVSFAVFEPETSREVPATDSPQPMVPDKSRTHTATSLSRDLTRISYNSVVSGGKRRTAPDDDCGILQPPDQPHIQCNRQPRRCSHPPVREYQWWLVQSAHLGLTVSSPCVRPNDASELADDEPVHG